MPRILGICVMLASLARSVAADTESRIDNSEALVAALPQASPGDRLILAADITWAAGNAISIPSDVVLDGNGHTITSTLASGTLLEQSGTSGVILQNLGLATANYGAWALSVRKGDLQMLNCDIRCRLIAWEDGSIALQDCDFTLQFPAGNDFSGPIGVYGGGATFTASNCVFRIGWNQRHMGTGFFHNFGGEPESRLTVSKCTIIGGQDPNNDEADRHQSVFLSDNTAGSAYVTEVMDCIIMAEAGSVFRSIGNGKVTSSHNNNAGMLRNPGIMAGGGPTGIRFYGTGSEGPKVEDRTGNLEEHNPFVNAIDGDLRLIAGSLSATGASDGGPIGADVGVLPVEFNAYNLDFSQFTPVRHRTPGYRETLFDGWPVLRQSDQQLCTLFERSQSSLGMRLIAMNTEGRESVQSAYQSFMTIPGWTYVIHAEGRRGVIPPLGAWNEEDLLPHAILGIADGNTVNPDSFITSATLDAGEDHWDTARVELTAPSNRLTIHLIHRTRGSWDRVDWREVRITSRAPIGAEVPPGLSGPLLGYINSVQPETDEERAERHRRVAERRARVPIIVHRGTTKFEPENTLEAYAKAMDLGADGVEFDPRQTLDGVLYTFHDESVDRVLRGFGPNRRMTYYELISFPFRNLQGHVTEESRVPTLLSFFELARQRAMLLHFDVKEPEIDDLLVGILDRLDMWDHVVMVTPAKEADHIRFHPNAHLMEYKPNNPDWNNPKQVERFLEGPGNAIFMTKDPSPAVQALGREVPGDRPLPEDLRAWWWPDGFSEPIGDPSANDADKGLRQ